MAIRVASLRGTLRVHIKPPPSDQLWFAFTSMPEIDFNLDSAVGDHKISSGHIALFLISRLKVRDKDSVSVTTLSILIFIFSITVINVLIGEDIVRLLINYPKKKVRYYIA